MSRNWTIGMLPVTAKEVENLLKKCQETIPTYKSATEFKNERLQEISNLITQAKGLEEQFYRKLDVNNLQEFSQKLIELSSNPVLSALKNDSIHFNDLVESAINKKKVDYDFSGENVSFLLSTDKEFMDSVKQSNLVQEQVEYEVTELLESFTQNLKEKSIELKEKKQISHFVQNYKNNIGRGLKSHLLSVKLVVENDKEYFKIEIPDTELKKSWKNRLENEFNFEFKKVEKNSIIDTIIDYLYSLKRGEKIENYIFQELLSYRQYTGGKKDIASDKSVIKGFLGEVRNNAIINYFAESRIAIPTGALLTMTENGKSVQIPIDTVIKTILGAAGMQVKNYKEVKGQITLGKIGEETMEMKNFLTGRIRVTDKLWETLFASYHYNIAKTDLFEAEREEIIKVAEEDSKEYFDTFLNNIIKLSDVFSTKANSESLFVDKQEYLNVFFVVGDKYIPSSEILLALYEQIQNMPNQKLISSSYRIENNTSAVPLYPQKARGNFEKALKNVKINYKIILNTAELFDSALRRIES